MTNVEKYFLQLKDIISDGYDFAVKENGEPIACPDIRCEDCMFYNMKRDCLSGMMNWMFREAV